MAALASEMPCVVSVEQVWATVLVARVSGTASAAELAWAWAIALASASRALARAYPEE